MTCHPYPERVARCAGLMKAAGLDALLLAKPANMAYTVVVKPDGPQILTDYVRKLEI